MEALPRGSHRRAVLAAGKRVAGSLPLRSFFTIPRYEGAVITPGRVRNLYRNRWEVFHLRETLRSRPIKLTVEPTNVCNLRCPACFTGVGELGRGKRPLPLALFERLLAELGAYLFQVEFTNWGEPLLAKDFPALVRAAAGRGISTTTSTNLSLPLDRERADALVASGLHVLGVSIDGARQDTYERYRVRGDLALVLRNCRLLADAKRRLASATPKLVWEFHVFPHNLGDVGAATAMAADIGMEISVSKGWVVGPEWRSGDDLRFFLGDPEPFPCLFLWQFAVVNNDGGVAPCCGAFYREDDMGTLGGDDAPTFAAIWNGPRFREARRLYRSRADAAAETRARICHDCPSTVLWERWTRHVASGAPPETFHTGGSFNDGFNYFWNRRPPR